MFVSFISFFGEYPVSDPALQGKKKKKKIKKEKSKERNIFHAVSIRPPGEDHTALKLFRFDKVPKCYTHQGKLEFAVM